MRFATRTFLTSFVPFAMLLAASFWMVRASVIATVRDGLRASDRDNQLAMMREQARSEARNQTLLRGVAENSTLKAGLQLLSTERSARDQARDTVQDQLSEIGYSLDFDFIMVAGIEGQPLAAVVRDAGGFVPINLTGPHPPQQGIFSADDRLYDLTSASIYEGGAQVAVLTVGSRFDLSRFGAPAVLLHKGTVVAVKTRDLAPAQIESALAGCRPSIECEVNIQDQEYLSLPLRLLPVGPPAEAGGDGYILRTLQNVDAASAPLRAVLQRLFLMSGLVALAAMLGISAVSARSIARPLAEVVAHLRSTAPTGEIAEFPERQGGVQEIRDLMQGFNHAAKSVREGRERLTQAYVQFVGSLAQALDARDAYTAGHSRRVSEYSCAIARAMNLPERDVETIRVGALLHDLGKIGISDLVLQKAGRLTAEEEQLIRQHPVIGKRILENVKGLEAHLSIVELHHENWNGTGYPHGLMGQETPLQARIVKVADAYDAMSSDRPYRRGMSHVEALNVLKSVTGTEMDAAVVEVFSMLGDQRKQQTVLAGSPSLHALSQVLQSENARPDPPASHAHNTTRESTSEAVQEAGTGKETS